MKFRSVRRAGTIAGFVMLPTIACGATHSGGADAGGGGRDAGCGQTALGGQGGTANGGSRASAGGSGGIVQAGGSSNAGGAGGSQPKSVLDWLWWWQAQTCDPTAGAPRADANDPVGHACDSAPLLTQADVAGLDGTWEVTAHHENACGCTTDGADHLGKGYPYAGSQTGPWLNGGMYVRFGGCETQAQCDSGIALDDFRASAANKLADGRLCYVQASGTSTGAELFDDFIEVIDADHVRLTQRFAEVSGQTAEQLWAAGDLACTRVRSVELHRISAVP